MSDKGTSEGWGAREGVLIHSRKVLGGSHEKTLRPKMSVKAIQIHFGNNFACGTRHIIQALHVGVHCRQLLIGHLTSLR